MGITFISKTNQLKWKNQARLRKTIVSFVSRETGLVSPKISIAFIALDFDAFRELHDQFMTNKEDTDILTFQYGPLTGDIFLCIPLISDNAAEFGVDFISELHRILFHGVLHILGYKDKTSEDAEKMRAAEDLFLQHYLSIN